MLSSFFSVFIADPQAEHDEEGVFAHGNIDNHTTRKSHHFATIVSLFMAQGNTSDICGKLFAAIDVRHDHMMECKHHHVLQKYGLWHNLGHSEHLVAKEIQVSQRAEAK